MIQRVQSLWLLASTACAVIFLFLPIYYGEFIGGANNKYTVRENLILFAGVALVGMISFITIFFYKNRNKQKTLILINIFFTLAVFVLQYFLIESLKKELGMARGEWQIAAVLPVFIMLFHFFAYKGISQDEALLNSADRMR
ncbi:MAG: DUF4293 domain-containing protein [Chitinophagia bacterium]|jgi:uncharacterized membrane protein